MKVYNYVLYDNGKLKLPDIWSFNLTFKNKIKLFTARRNKLKNRRRLLQKQCKRVYKK